MHFTFIPLQRRWHKVNSPSEISPILIYHAFRKMERINGGLF